LVGYGSAGRVFHALLLAAEPAIELACVVSSQALAVAQDWPGVTCVAHIDQALADPTLELVVIATPNASHYTLARAALLAGKHVVVDKPCTPTLAEATSLLALAKQQQRVFTVFQNRRFDSDFLALQAVLASGRLGRLVQVSAHFDRYRPQVPTRWREQDLPGSGLWFDLGPHLLDQVVALWGLPQALLLERAPLRDGALVDDWFHAVLRYGSAHGGLRVILHASTLAAHAGPRWQAHGTLGSFTQWGLDTQEAALKSGQRPDQAEPTAWGVPEQPGQLTVWHTLPGVGQPVQVDQAAPALNGRYTDYYRQLARCLRGQETAPMVQPQQIEQVMRLLCAGVQSSENGAWQAP
jgi:predicted dehydrogenase